MRLTLCFGFLISVLHRGGFKIKLPWREKSTVFPENSERDYLPPQLLFPQKPSGSLSRTHRSEAYPLCKNAITNPFNRDTEGPPKNVLFTTLRLNRKRAAFPQRSAENGFPMSGGMQSGACVLLAVNIYCQPEPERSMARRQGGAEPLSISVYYYSLLRKAPKTAAVARKKAEGRGEVLFQQWLWLV